MLMCIVAAQARAGEARDCGSSACANLPPAAPPLVRLEKLGDSGVQVTSSAGGNYAVTLSSSDSATDASGHLAAGEAQRKSLDAEFRGHLGYFFNLDLRGDLTNVKRDTDDELFALQPLDSVGDNRRAMENLDLKAVFLGDRLSFSSSRRASTLTPLARNSFETRGLSGQDRLSAWLWHSGKDGLSLEGATSRIDANYEDLTKLTTADPLQVKNRETRQVRSNLKVGWAGVFVTARDWAALTPDQKGDRAKSAEIEAGASVALSDLHDDANFHAFSGLLPDSIWVSATRGTIEHSLASSSPGQTEKSAVGVTRSWDGGSVNLSYWRSTIEPEALLPRDAEWRGHGLDFGGSVTPGHWTLSGNLSWYRAEDLVLLNSSAENSLGGSLFVSWSAPSWPKLSAGVTNYGYEADYLDNHGLERNGSVRYQLMLDCSSLIAGTLADKSAQLSFLASFDASNSRSQWSQAGSSSAAGNMFFGFRFARPVAP
jgi:hypothetical protein